MGESSLIMVKFFSLMICCMMRTIISLEFIYIWSGNLIFLVQLSESLRNNFSCCAKKHVYFLFVNCFKYFLSMRTFYELF